MQVTIKTFKEDYAVDVKFHRAPSLTAAVRADAETLVRTCIANGIEDSEFSLTEYILGDVTADVVKVGPLTYLVHFYIDDDISPFAVVEVK